MCDGCDQREILSSRFSPAGIEPGNKFDSCNIPNIKLWILRGKLLFNFLWIHIHNFQNIWINWGWVLCYSVFIQKVLGICTIHEESTCGKLGCKTIAKYFECQCIDLFWVLILYQFLQRPDQRGF